MELCTQKIINMYLRSIDFFMAILQRKNGKKINQVTQQMLKEHCGCEEGRMQVGKKKPSIMKVDVFDQPEDQFYSKKLKEDAPF